MAKKNSREMRVARAKRRVQTLVDQGVPFNPQTASPTLRDRAVENLSMQAGRRNLIGNKSGSIAAAAVLSGSVNKAVARRPQKPGTVVKSKYR